MNVLRRRVVSSCVVVQLRASMRGFRFVALSCVSVLRCPPHGNVLVLGPCNRAFATHRTAIDVVFVLAYSVLLARMLLFGDRWLPQLYTQGVFSALTKAETEGQRVSHMKHYRFDKDIEALLRLPRIEFWQINVYMFVLPCTTAVVGGATAAVLAPEAAVDDIRK